MLLQRRIKADRSVRRRLGIHNGKARLSNSDLQFNPVSINLPYAFDPVSFNGAGVAAVTSIRVGIVATNNR